MTRSHRSDSPSPLGVRLLYWRRLRGISQLALATSAGTTSRHISFLETGRSRPGRDMVIRLSEVLDIPLRDRNRLLESAGLQGSYPEEDLGTAKLRPFRAAIERMLRAHEPYPALVVDGHWNVIAANQASSALFGDLTGPSPIRRLYGDPSISDAIINWPDVAWAALARLQQKLRRVPHDVELQALVALAEAAVADLPRRQTPEHDLVICPRFRIGDQVIRTISMVARFDTAVEVTLDELAIELTYPEDAAAERFFRELAESRPAAEIRRVAWSEEWATDDK